MAKKLAPPSVDDLEKLAARFDSYIRKTSFGGRPNYDNLYQIAQDSVAVLQTILACHKAKTPNYNSRLQSMQSILTTFFNAAHPYAEDYNSRDYCTFCLRYEHYTTPEKGRHNDDCPWWLAKKFLDNNTALPPLVSAEIYNRMYDILVTVVNADTTINTGYLSRKSCIFCANSAKTQKAIIHDYECPYHQAEQFVLNHQRINLEHETETTQQ